MKQHTNDAAALHITTLSVSGLACYECAAHVVRMLEGANGVVHVEARRGQREFVVEHLQALIDAAGVAAAVRVLGYGAEVATSAPDVDCARPAAQAAALHLMLL